MSNGNGHAPAIGDVLTSRAQLPRQQSESQRTLRNYEWSNDDSREGRGSVGRRIQAIAADLVQRTGGWPKRVGDKLFVVSDSHEVNWLNSTSQLFAYIDSHCSVNWKNGEDKISKPEFFEFLRTSVESYESIERFPHFPALPTIYYAYPPLPESDGSALNWLISRFTPSSEVDRELIRALALSLFWGGAAGSRPAWLITGDDDDRGRGRGIGKSKLVELMSHLTGGAIEIDPDSNIATVKTRLLSPGARNQRVCRLDNVKTHRFSWAELEGLITSPIISGRELYAGEGRRPQLLTFAVTLNGASLSTDLAQRCVILHLARPDYTESWEPETRHFIEQNRWAIISDIGQILLSTNHNQ